MLGVFLSTLPARGATTFSPLSSVRLSISIHAPREGSDLFGAANTIHVSISIHAPREGSDLKTSIYARSRRKFLSTLPARGATPHGRRHIGILRFLSTLPARGATAGRTA